MPPKDKYTDPELRDQVKEEIHKGDKGGAPGQWSARKAQMMASEYKKRGGEYNTDKSQQDESQKNLSKWGEEEWQTKEGSGNAKQADGTEKRYLPKKAWENMTEQEKEETEKKKEEGSKEGKQFVQNTGKAKESRKQANDEESKEYEKKQGGKKRNGEDEKAADGNEDEEEEEEEDEAEAEYQNDEEASEDEDGNDQENEEEEEDEGSGDKKTDDAKPGQKRTRGQQKGSNKSQKSNSGTGKPNGTVGSKHMDAEEPNPRGSADRLPKKGQSAHWKAMPGYVDGEVVEVLTKGKKVDGKDVKASEKDPKIVLKSSKSGKICVHLPNACFYE